MFHCSSSNRRSFLKSACLSISTAGILAGSGSEKKGSSEPSLVQRLGYAAETRLLLLSSDEFGETHASNTGIIQAWEAGILKATTWLAPSTWAPEAADYVRKHPKMDVGVHLTLTMGHKEAIGWRPLLPRTDVPGLYTPDGFLYQTGVEVWKHTTATEVKRESQAQIELAIKMGIDPSHLDPHDGILGNLTGNLPDFAKIYVELAEEFSLPVRMPPTQEKLVEMGLPGIRPMISKKGVLMADSGAAMEGRENYRKMLHELPKGAVSEIYVHPAVECDEIKAARKDWWQQGVGEHRLLTKDREELRQALKEEGIALIGWREIRDLQRSGAKA